MNYALSTIWHERQRFLPGILAVSFSAVLIAVQSGLMIGLATMMSVPVDESRADLWVGYPGVLSVDLGRQIPERWTSRVAAHPEVERVEPCLVGFSIWTRVTARDDVPATPEVITVVGTSLGPESLGAVQFLRDHPDLMARLAEPDTVAIDEVDLGRLGIRGVGDTAVAFGKRVRVVGIVKGYRSLAGPYVFCSTETARALLRERPGGVTYVLAKTRTPDDAAAVARRMNASYTSLSAFTADEFSFRSRKYWLTRTKAGIAIGFTALLGLVVGGVVTSQTLYAATAASQREFATMRAMGIPAWRLRFTVVEQAFWVGLFGVLLAAPVTLVLAEAANHLGTQVVMHPLAVAAAAGVTMLMALASGLAALRSVQGTDPAHNLR